MKYFLNVKFLIIFVCFECGLDSFIFGQDQKSIALAEKMTNEQVIPYFKQKN